VIVNEIGEIGLDGAILAEATGGLRMAMLANGCVCCALGSDLAVTVGQLVDSYGPGLRRIVLETSGLSKPGPVLRGLAGLAPLRLRVSVIATFDCLRGAEVANFEEAAAQWAGAQALVLTRRDLAAPSQIEAARAMAQAINPTADIIDFDDRHAGVVAAFARRASAPLTVLNVTGPQHPRIAVMLVRWLAKPTWDDLAAWLDNLSGLLGERLLRVKGVVEVAELDQPLLVQSVGTMFSPPCPFTGSVDTQFLVVIARDASPDELVQIAPVMPVVINRLGTPDPFARGSSAPWRAR
jgi:G3E family GTPase